MPIPDYQTFLLPLLTLLADGQERSLRDAIDALADRFGLTEEERSARLPSGRQRILDNRVSWAATYLRQARLLESPRRGFLRISDRGRAVLASAPTRIDVRFLEQFPEFQAFRTRRPSGTAPGTPAADESPETPEEQIERAHVAIRQALAAELIDRILAAPPALFEQLVVDLLVRMGYGGSHGEAAQAVGRSGDGGIDGIVKEDRLGLETIYIQAKRWQGPVGRPEVQRFVGALHGRGARKGVFVTTSTFTQEARDFARQLTPFTLVLVDGTQLAELLIDYDVGVTPVKTYTVKRIDPGFFGEV